MQDARTTNREPADIRIAVGVVLLAALAMAVDHLLGDDPGLEDPLAFLISLALCIVLAAFLFGWVLPRTRRTSTSREAISALILSIIAIVPGIGTLWLGLPFILAGAGVASGRRARRHAPTDARALAAIVVGAIVIAGGSIVYLLEATKKLT